METQTSAGVAGTQVLPSLASSVLRNVFGGTQKEGKSTEEIAPNSSVEVPSEIAQKVLTRLGTRKERAAAELGISAGQPGARQSRWDRVVEAEAGVPAR